MEQGAKKVNEIIGKNAKSETAKISITPKITVVE